MKIFLRMRRGISAVKAGRIAVVLISLLVLLPKPTAGEAAIPGEFCSGPGAITGVGSTTQSPLHVSLFIPRYQVACPAATGLITYQGLGDKAGSDAAVRHSLGPNRNSPYTFYTSDLPLSAAEWYSAYSDIYSPFSPRLLSSLSHFPIFTNGFAVGYNLGSCPSSPAVQLSRDTLALVYSGVITRWDHPLIVRHNLHLASCNLSIKVAVRADPAGSNIILKDYLSSANPVFNPYRAKELSTLWPSTLNISCYGAGEAGMSQCLKVPGAIGYPEYKRAKADGISMAAIENATSSQFVKPSTSSSVAWPDNCDVTTRAAAPPPSASDWSSFTLTNTPVGYPLCAFSYVFVFRSMMHATSSVLSTAQVRNTVDYMTTIASDDVQNRLPANGYASLSPNFRQALRQGVSDISWY